MQSVLWYMPEQKPPSIFEPRWIPNDLLDAFHRSDTSAHRLCSSSAGWVERFGEDLLLSWKEDAFRDYMLQVTLSWCETRSLKVNRIFSKHLPKQSENRIAPTLVWGDATLPLQTVVTENGMRFGLDFAAGYSAGLFIDQRANRTFLRRIAPSKLLNTFAYTGAFTVASIFGGTKETLSIDLSKKSLDRARENFALNGLSLDNHRFFPDDVMEVLPRLARKGETFGAIILDPPTFSRSHTGRRWQVEHDLAELIQQAIEVAESQCAILISTNCSRIGVRDLDAIARLALKTSRRAGTVHHEASVPDMPQFTAPRTAWLLMK